MYRYGSLFCGAGLFDYGLHRVLPDLDCRFAVELHAKRRAIFAAHNPSAMMLGDIAEVDASALPPIDGLIGGVPCNTHSTTNTAGTRGLAPEWEHARRLTEALAPRWTLWESSAKDRSWRRWVPAVRSDLHACGHASVCFRVRTAGRNAPHDRDRAFVVSWDRTTDAHAQGEPARAVHAEVARMRAAPAAVWDGRTPARAHGRMDDGVDRELAIAIGYGVDQRTAEDAGRVLGALLSEVAV